VGLQHWKEHVAKLEDSRVAKFARALPDDPLGGKLLAGLFSNSPFLSHCILRDVEFFVRLVQEGPERLFEDVLASLGEPETGTANRNTVMARLRTARTRTALLVAVADLTDHWTLEQVTGALTRFADTALSASLVHLLRQAEERGELELPESEQPEQRCGLVVLAMGKYGSCCSIRRGSTTAAGGAFRKPWSG
jgi:glutamate-ammonia-ligase adenylyltransferase